MTDTITLDAPKTSTAAITEALTKVYGQAKLVSELTGR